jgi:hypothetical protein
MVGVPLKGATCERGGFGSPKCANRRAKTSSLTVGVGAILA